ncbi:MAG: hypothetical protein CV087_10235 [Candidatus Brocadia sp. WS118]|nr:MAG: hypothetical protein CV087_10235 [Candidatus Brocadia sp. WS118]
MTFILLLIGLGLSQNRKVETDTLKARAAFKIRLSGTWYDRSSFFGYLNGSNQLGNSGIAADAITTDKIQDAQVANADIVDPWVYITAGNGLHITSSNIVLGQSVTMSVNTDDSTITIINDTLHVIDGGSATIILNSDSTIINNNGLKVNHDTTYFYAAPGASPIFGHWYSKNGGVFRDIENHPWAQGIINDTIYYPTPASIANGRFDAWGNSGGETLYVFNKAGDSQSFVLTTDSTRYTISSITFAENDSVFLSTTGTVLIDNIYLLSTNGLTLRDSSITGQKIAAGTINYEHASQALKDSINGWKTNVDDTTALKQFTGERVYLNRLAIGKLGGGWFTKSDSLYPEGVIAFDCPFPGFQLLRDTYINNGRILYAEWAGVVGGDANDDTEGIWNCLDIVSAGAAKKIILPADTIFISLANSDHDKALLLIPSNCTLSGAGIDETIIKRVPGERGDDGLLIANFGYDDSPDYTGAHDIVLENFTITEGNTTKKSGTGDLIALAHCERVTVRNVKGLNHDQHLIDIVGVKDLLVTDCIDSNSVVNAGQTASFQIDTPDDAAAAWGVYVDDTPNININLYRNTIKANSQSYAFHLHRGRNQTSKNIQIKDNIIDGDISAGIYKDNTYEVQGLTIEGNIIRLNNTSADSRGIYLATDSTIAAGAFKDVQIINNTITGVATLGILVGGGTFNGRYQHATGINIKNNMLYLDFKSSSVSGVFTGIQVTRGEDATISNNDIRIIPDAPNNTVEYAIEVDNQELVDISNNRIFLVEQADSANFYGIYQTANTAYAAGFTCNTIIKNNMLYGDGYRYGVIITNTGSPTPTNCKGIISGNFVYTDSIGISHYYESVPMMDGTNNIHYVEWPADIRAGAGKDSIYYAVVTDSMNEQNIPLRYSKKGEGAYASGWDYRVWYYSTSSPFNQESEIYGGLQYVSPDSVIGIQLADWRIDLTVTPNLNNFDLITGNAGIHITINATSFKPVIRTDGYIKVRVGL